MKNIIIVFCLLITPTLLGCGAKRPAGIPPLHPAKITVTNAGNPITNAVVIFAKIGKAEGSWSASGETDNSGVAQIKTLQGEWKGTGVPEGDYTVFVIKPIRIVENPPEEMTDDPSAMEKYFYDLAKREAEMVNEIPECISNPALTPLTASIKSGEALTMNIDVSEYM
ncbi:MAG: hypothetical protein ACRC2T_18825 [Thermoguttaceae bacterium]